MGFNSGFKGLKVEDTALISQYAHIHKNITFTSIPQSACFHRWFISIGPESYENIQV